MTPALMHPDEEQRLASLLRLRQLDTAPEARFDRLTSLASIVCGSPIALLSLVDRNRQWFKSSVGLEAAETPREQSFCAHAILADAHLPFIVEDSLADLRFADNPLVVGYPRVRFYAGQVLRDPAGLPMGTLCVIDHRPRRLADAQVLALQHLAALVEQELERTASAESLYDLARDQNNKSLILDTLSEGLVLQDPTGVIVHWNRAAEEVLGLTADELRGLRPTDPRWAATRPDGEPWPGETHPPMLALQSGSPVLDELMALARGDGTRRWLKVNSRPVAEADGAVTGVVTAFRDVTAEVDEAARRGELEIALEHSEEKARVSLEALEQGVLLTDLHGTIHLMNSAAERILGYGPAELTKMWLSPQWITFDEDGAVLPRERRPVVRSFSGETVTGELVGWQRRDGKRILLRISCLPSSDGVGRVVVAFTDVTAERLAQRLLDATLETAPVGLVIFDGRSAIQRCNQTFAAQTGRDAEDLLGSDIVDVVHPLDRREARELACLLASGARRSGSLEQRFIRPDGTEIWVEVQLALIPGSQPPLSIAAVFDVTERRRMILELSRFERLFRHSDDMMSVVDARGRILYASPSNSRILGYPDGSRVPRRILAMVHPDDALIAAERFGRLVAGDDPAEPLTVRVAAYSGEPRHIECVGVNLLADPAVRGIVITGRDVTERVHRTAELAHRAHHDPLTGLPNRDMLEERLDQALARAAQDVTHVAVCFIDLDGFKLVNDVLGHGAGDRALIGVAERLRGVVRANDTAARVGGDEFVVVFDQVADIAAALAAAERLRDSVVSFGRSSSSTVPFGASVGLAVSSPGDTVEGICARADAALYRAKARGVGSVELACEVDAAVPTSPETWPATSGVPSVQVHTVSA